MAQITRYGRIWPPNFTPAFIELFCWREWNKIENPELPRWQHMKNAALLLIPDLKYTWNPWLEKMCEAYSNYSYIAAMGCTSSTKTHSFHLLAFLDYMCDPLNTQVICTTTSSSGLERRMWPIMAGLYYGLKPAQWVIRSSPYKMIMADKTDTKHTIRAMPIAPKADKAEITDNIIGAHTKRVIWLVDEATSAPDAIFAAWSNLSSSTTHRRLGMLGNPDDPLDTLGRFSMPKSGADSITADTEEWEFEYEGEKGKGLHFDGEKSPNLDHPKNPDGSSRWNFMFGHFNMEKFDAIKEKEPLTYWRFCRGWYADASVVPKVITMEEIDKYKCRSKALFLGATTTFAALDPAFGGDRCPLKIFRKGIDAETKKWCMEQVDTFIVPIPPKCIKGEVIGKFVIEKAREYGFTQIGIDTTTDNSAPAEYIKLNSELDVIEITFGGNPSKEPVSPSDQTPCNERYDRKVSELWFTMKQCLPQIRNIDIDTCVEMCSRYFTRKGKPEKLCVETKMEMKERSHGKSPDLGDTISLACFVFRKLGGFEPPYAEKKSKSWSKSTRKKNAVYSSKNSYEE